MEEGIKRLERNQHTLFVDDSNIVFNNGNNFGSSFKQEFGSIRTDITES